MPFGDPITAEQRQKAIAVRRARAASLRSDFPACDEEIWSELAAIAIVKLPPYGVPCTTGRMERWLRILEIPLDAYYRWSGAGLSGNDTATRLADFPKRNPTWPLKAWLGLILEGKADGQFDEVSA